MVMSGLGGASSMSLMPGGVAPGGPGAARYERAKWAGLGGGWASTPKHASCMHRMVLGLLIMRNIVQV